MLYDNRFVVCPDVFLKGPYPLIVVPDRNGPLEMMYPIADEEFQQLKRTYPDRGVSLTSSVKPPPSDTAR